MNICSGKPVRLKDYLKFIEKLYEKKCKTKKIAKQKLKYSKRMALIQKLKNL